LGLLDNAVGKGTVPLSPLLENSKMETKIEVRMIRRMNRMPSILLCKIKEGRKSICDVEIRCRLRSPIVKKDIAIVEEKLLVLVDEEVPVKTAPTTTPSKTTTTPTTTTTAAPTNKQPSVSSNNSNTPSSSSSTNSKNVVPSLSKEEAEDDEEGPNRYLMILCNPNHNILFSIDNIVSNDVLEWELGNIDQKINLIASKGGKIPPDLLDRKQQVLLKLNILEVIFRCFIRIYVFYYDKIQASSGNLDPEVYFNTLREKIKEEKAIAAKYKDTNVEWAKLALKRAKIMASFRYVYRFFTLSFRKTNLLQAWKSNSYLLL
jgi:hypothetical protein